MEVVSCGFCSSCAPAGWFVVPILESTTRMTWHELTEESQASGRPRSRGSRLQGAWQHADLSRPKPHGSSKIKRTTANSSARRNRLCFSPAPCCVPALSRGKWAVFRVCHKNTGKWYRPSCRHGSTLQQQVGSNMCLQARVFAWLSQAAKL